MCDMAKTGSPPLLLIHTVLSVCSDAYTQVPVINGPMSSRILHSQARPGCAGWRLSLDEPLSPLWTPLTPSPHHLGSARPFAMRGHGFSMLSLRSWFGPWVERWPTLLPCITTAYDGHNFDRVSRACLAVWLLARDRPLLCPRIPDLCSALRLDRLGNYPE